MSKLSEEEEIRLQELLDGYIDRLEKTEVQLKQGKVAESKIPISLYSIAKTYQNIGIVKIHSEEYNDAMNLFSLSGKYYVNSAKEAQQAEGDLNTFQRIPLTFLEGLYAGLVSGNLDDCQIIAHDILELPPAQSPPHEFIEDHVEYHTDKYFLSRCIAGAVIDQIQQEDFGKLNEINKGKPKIHAKYGQGVLNFCRGVHNSDPILIEQGIQSIIEYHRDRHDNENIITQIMCLEATALYILALYRGYDHTIDSCFIPDEFVESAVL